ncbi:hypothetical protein GCM10028783_07610 [Modestobacter muralis]
MQLPGQVCPHCHSPAAADPGAAVLDAVAAASSACSVARTPSGDVGPVRSATDRRAPSSPGRGRFPPAGRGVAVLLASQAPPLLRAEAGQPPRPAQDGNGTARCARVAPWLAC